MSGPARVCSSWRGATAAGTSSTRISSAIRSRAVLADGDTLYAALDLGHFGAKLWRRERAGPWRELPAPAFPPKPEDAGRRPASLVARHDLGDRAGRRAGPPVGRHDAGRAVPLRRWRRALGAERGAVAHARAAAMDGRRRRRAARHQLGAGRSARPRRHPHRRLDRAGMWASRDGGASWRIINRGM